MSKILKLNKEQKKVWGRTKKIIRGVAAITGFLGTGLYLNDKYIERVENMIDVTIDSQEIAVKLKEDLMKKDKDFEYIDTKQIAKAIELEKIKAKNLSNYIDNIKNNKLD